jgi:hypothetical protein
MNRGPTLLHYDLKVVTYSNSTRSQHHFTIRAYLKNGKRWAKFPFLAAQSRMIVVGRICGYTLGPNRLLCVLVDSFNFLGGNDVSQPSVPQTPQSAKRSLRDLWDRSDVDDGSIGPSTPSKVPRFAVEDDDPSPLANSSQGEGQVQVAATPFVPETPPPAWPSEGTEAGEDDLPATQGKRPQGSRKTPKRT